MDDHGEGFDSVQWPRDPEAQEPQNHDQSTFSPSRALPVRTNSRRSESMSSEPQAGDNADAVDLAGIGVDGILECTVDTPLKENDGTKDAYVSYLVTTHVTSISSPPSPCTDPQCRPISRPLTARTFLSDDASPTSSSCAALSTKTSRHVESLPFLRRTAWHMSVEIDSAQTSLKGVLGHYIAS